MKIVQLTALAASVLPGKVLAHGGHAPVSDAWHGFVHAGPMLVVLVLVLAGGAALVIGRGNRP